MKKRIQFNADFSDSDANDILNHVESIKDKVFKPSEFTYIEIIRDAKLCEIVSDNIIEPVIITNVDFDGAVVNHSEIEPNGLNVKIDISFIVDSDALDFLNYIESIKGKTTTNNKSCRFFDCNHDEKPIKLDGPYSYIDFDGVVVAH